MLICIFLIPYATGRNLYFCFSNPDWVKWSISIWVLTTASLKCGISVNVALVTLSNLNGHKDYTSFLIPLSAIVPDNSNSSLVVIVSVEPGVVINSLVACALNSFSVWFAQIYSQSGSVSLSQFVFLF